MKAKIYRFLFIILLIIAVVLLSLIIRKRVNRNFDEKENQEIVEQFFDIYSYNNQDFENNIDTKNIENIEDIEDIENNVKVNKVQSLKMRGYDVIGIVTIPKIQIEYPILALEKSNPEETKVPMKFAIVKYWGGNVNDYGNLSIAGHNNHDGTMFGKTKKLVVGDIVKLTDTNNQTISYEIYDIFITDPNDVNILKTEDNSIREVTLITCTNGNKQRLVLKAKEIK